MLTHRGSRTLATGKGTEAITPALLTGPHSPAYTAGSEKQRALESSCLALAPPAPPKGLLTLLVQWARWSFARYLKLRWVSSSAVQAARFSLYSIQPVFCLQHLAVPSPLLKVVTVLLVSGPQILISLTGQDGGTGPGLVA